MLAENNITGHVTTLREKLTELAPGLLGKYPIANYVRQVDASPKWQRYYYMNPELKNILTEILSGYGLRVMANYHKLALVLLIRNSLPRLEKKNIPQDIKGFYLEWFRKVLKDISLQPDAYYHVGDFPFIQDLAVCSLRAIPVGGAWFVEISRAKEWTGESGSTENEKDIPIRNIKNVIAKLKLRRLIAPILYRIGFFKMYYQIHTYARFLFRFTPEEMDKAYLRIAELLRRNKKMKGLYRRSWFLDPQLENISPELVYLRKIPEDNGAKVLQTVTFQSAIDNAIALSPKRRKLYEEGKYTPTTFSFVWPRKEMLKWADSQKDLSTAA